MTENQKLWLEEIIEDHHVAASNERLWALGADDAETTEMHLANSDEHIEFADMLEALLRSKEA